MMFLRLRCELLIRRLGWTGALVIVLAAAAAIVQFGLLPAEQVQRVALSHQLVTLKQASPPTQTANSINQTRLTAFDALMPPLSQYSAALHTLFDLAADHHLMIAQADYSTQPSTEGGFVAYDLVLPIKGSYRQIRGFIDDALQCLPTLAVLGMTFSRDDAHAADVQANLHLRLYMRSGT